MAIAISQTINKKYFKLQKRFQFQYFNGKKMTMTNDQTISNPVEKRSEFRNDFKIKNITDF